ncbi:MAG: tRNA pseudouridine(38-40) synthase TruA [Oligoflexales bacterium]|nr:tRNA pseudouridine(38-40) synthase TruA [Oligoflexales bacterium]
MSEHKKYRLDLSYIGTNYQGWQTQPNGQGVQDYLRRALEIFLRHPVKLIGASRTDAGVHAEHQVTCFSTSVCINEGKLLRALNALTPHDVGIMSIKQVSEGFHPIFSCTGKVYRYRLWTSESISPFVDRYVWKVPGSLDIDLIERLSGELLGKHDFTSFSASDSDVTSRVREIRDLFIDKRGPLINIWIVGDGFLKQMVRIIVGTLVEFGLKKKRFGSIAEILEAMDRKRAGITAPATGLSLVRIYYESIPSLASIIEESHNGYCMAFSFIVT